MVSPHVSQQSPGAEGEGASQDRQWPGIYAIHEYDWKGNGG